ncbi:DUF3885 domain-containing protein [Methylophilus sp. OH31]|uniref:DUF3885 domain-containing protein n=1 Tax=Methylophilus sp. OH31 TaxID=1387312 RepID=UPI00046565D0|nr:DUF3885 domain-containing protein [Methylophilus sp. OH31]
MIDQAFQAFGKNSFQHAVFYSNENCLRFELSQGDEGSYVNMFTTALNKGTKIFETVFESTEELSVCLAFPGNSYLSNFSVFKELKKLQIEIPRNAHTLKEWVEEDKHYRNYIFFKTNKSQLQKLLFGKLGAELGIKPSFWFDLYIYNIDLMVLLHPYDDRGMDVVGANKFMLKRLYKQFNNWLLKYDIEIMRQWFGVI